ncbi:MAG TPA: ATP-binding protein [Pseudonocardiaceae bacterium]
MTDTTAPPVPLDQDAARALALDLKRITSAVLSVVDSERPSARLFRAVTNHLGRSLHDMVSVSAEFRTWEHASLQLGVDAYLVRHESTTGWYGIRGQGIDLNESLLSLLTSADREGGPELSEPEYVTTATGPKTSTEAIQVGLVPTTAPTGEPVLVGIRGPLPHMGPMARCRLDVVAASREVATRTRDEIEQLVAAHDVVRGQVVAFGVSEFRGNELVTFLPRPTLTEQQVVLPDGVLAGIEEHILGVAEHAERLLAAGQHLKRGLLLYGPPGTGKTHTVRYLAGRLPHTTVVVLTGAAMRYINQAAALARRFQPSMVVLEDVDLVANDRSMGSGTNPVLFSLLDAMDGIGSDADVTFVLTTNRAEVLERALADRPGRVDLAVEIPRPDAIGRERLLRLYSDGVSVTADLAPVIAATEGVTASFLKELVRRAVLVGLREGTSTVTDAALRTALDVMTASHNALTRSLLGATQPTGTAT